MGAPPPTDDRRRPGKNGIDHEQTQAIRDVRSRWDQFHENEWPDFRQEDKDTHGALFSGISGLRKMLFGLLIGAITFAAGLLAYVAAAISTIHAEVDRLDEEVKSVEIIAREHEAEGMEIGRRLRVDVDENEDDIKELRRYHRLNNHRSD